MTSPTPPSPERRTAPRVPCSLGTYVYSPADGRQAGEPAVLRDISTHGLGFQCAHEFPVGRLLIVELPVTPRRVPRPFLARVVHATPQGPDTWLIGCTFLWSLPDAALREVCGIGTPP